MISRLSKTDFPTRNRRTIPPFAGSTGRRITCWRSGTLPAIVIPFSLLRVIPSAICEHEAGLIGFPQYYEPLATLSRPEHLSQVFGCLSVPPYQPSPKRLQPSRYLHDCSGGFRLEHFAGRGFYPTENRGLCTAHTQKRLMTLTNTMTGL